MFFSKQMVTRESCLEGRSEPLEIDEFHYINKTPMRPPFQIDSEFIIFAMGCFWGAERRFWQQNGVSVTAAVYVGGYTPNPTYEETCSGLTGHTEGVLVVFDPKTISLASLLKVFWESHDPTQGMRQGNDIGTQYRSGIYCNNNDQLQIALASKSAVQPKLTDIGYGSITTEIELVSDYYYAERYHQQYLAKNPNGYCGLRGTGIHCEGRLLGGKAYSLGARRFYSQH